MSRTKVSVAGQLEFSEDQGRLMCSVEVGKGSRRCTAWIDVPLPNEEGDLPGLGPAPKEPPETASKQAKDSFYYAREGYDQALHEHPNYKQAVSKFIELQYREPQPGPLEGMWIYRSKLCRIESGEPPDMVRDALLVKHYMLRQERYYDKVRREVEALENMEKLERVSREPIPDSVRLFVWQRDRGQCVKCGGREKLEFDHIIPVASGGSNTERNIQLLCEGCNRSKGASI